LRLRKLFSERVSHTGVGRELLLCRKSVHPGVRSLWEFHEANDPDRIALEHDGCGAAIRVAPVGLVLSPEDLPTIVAGAREASISTHGGSHALAGAAATAAAVSAAVRGASGEEIAEFAERAAVLAEQQWPHSDGALFSQAVHSTRSDFLSKRVNVQAQDIAESCFPDSPLTIVPLALALGTVMECARSAILLAANVGGDADSVASIAGGILGARNPNSVSDEWYDVVEHLNGHNLIALGEELSALRSENVV